MIQMFSAKNIFCRNSLAKAILCSSKRHSHLMISLPTPTDIEINRNISRATWVCRRYDPWLIHTLQSPQINNSLLCFFMGPRPIRGICQVIQRGYYTVARRYELYFWVAKQYFTNERSEWVKCCFCHEKIKFISSSHRVMLFLLYRQNDINKIIERNYQNYVIDKLTCEIIENKPLGSRM